MQNIKKIIYTLMLAGLAACSHTTDDATSLNTTKTESISRTAMVVTANSHATEAGAAILRKGGSAVDAAVAIEAVLSLVEPQSSGFGGGGFMVHYDAQTKAVSIYDGRETAPAGATADMFLRDGQRMPFLEAKNSGLSTGVPSVVGMLALAQSEQGKLDWSELFDAGIRLADEGFAISPRLFGMTDRFKKYIPKVASQGPTKAYEYFYSQQGEPHPVGYPLKNPDYATTLRNIANDAEWFYQSEFAEEIARVVQLEPRAGSLTAEDIRGFKPKKVTALCSTYREYRLCGPAPASSWVAVGAIMGMLEKVPDFGVNPAQDWLSFGEAQRLAYADRDQYVGDTDFVSVPLHGMLNKEYLYKRAQLINPERAAIKVVAGDPWLYEPLQQEKAARRYGQDQTDDRAGTTHFVVVDAEGDVVSMTATVESIFGSTRMAGGMFLNNELTDFSFQPMDANGQPIANAVAPLKRPRSSMSPTIVTDANGEFVLATGSPGGNSIIAYTAKTLMSILDWKMSPQAAVALPNLVARGDTVRIEKSVASTELIQSLRDYGFQVKESAGENSGLSVIQRDSSGQLIGGVDPRREGTIALVQVPIE